jgi:hypothetical protein
MGDLTGRIAVKAGSPEGYRALAGLTRAGHPDHALGELIKLVASHINNCRYCVAAHEEGGRKAGLSDDRIAATADWQASTLFDDRERAAFALTELLTRSDALAGAEDSAAAPVWSAAAEAFPGEELLQVVMTVVAINAWNRAMIAEAVSEGG